MIPLPAVVLLVSVFASPPPGDGPVLGPLAARLDSLAPGASGVFLAEVSRISEHDERPSDGELYQRVALSSLRSSGATRASLELIRATSGMATPWNMGRPAPPKARFSVKPDDFQAGRRYWFVTASDLDPRYPQGIAGCWSAESTQVAVLFERAVEQDAYAWHPEIWPSGTVTGWFDDSDHSSSTVRMWQAGRLRWQHRLDGLLTHRAAEAWDVLRADHLGNLRPPAYPAGALLLLAEVRTVMDSSNSFGLPARSWIVQHLLDVETGQLVASRVRADHNGDFERVYQMYDADGRIVYERIQDLLSAGGKSVGADREDWLRRYERWLDPRTGRVTQEQIRRYATIPTSYGSTTAWLPVDRKLGLAAGPLRVSSGP